ncbi:MAG: DUF4345 family protein [Gammaproteobacteria bacterium]|nr:DUF4345 family protein [Gammaproteobacteria bacterium]
MLRNFLLFSAFVWLPYGIACFLFPGLIGGINGIEATAGTGLIEFKAIYGGLQSGMGLLVIYALLNSRMERPALLMLVFLCGPMGFARYVATDFNVAVSLYTYFALVLEGATAFVAFWLLGDAQD